MCLALLSRFSMTMAMCDVCEMCLCVVCCAMLCALLWWCRAVLCCCGRGCGCGCGQEDSVAPGQLLFMSTPVLGVRCLGVASGVLVLDSACCCVSVLSAMLGQQIPVLATVTVPPCASGHYFYVPLYPAVTCSVLCAAEEYKKFVFFSFFLGHFLCSRVHRNAWFAVDTRVASVPEDFWTNFPTFPTRRQTSDPEVHSVPQCAQ